MTFHGSNNRWRFRFLYSMINNDHFLTNAPSIYLKIIIRDPKNFGKRKLVPRNRNLINAIIARQTPAKAAIPILIIEFNYGELQNYWGPIWNTHSALEVRRRRILIMSILSQVLFRPQYKFRRGLATSPPISSRRISIRLKHLLGMGSLGPVKPTVWYCKVLWGRHLITETCTGPNRSALNFATRNYLPRTPKFLPTFWEYFTWAKLTKFVTENAPERIVIHFSTSN